MATEKRITELIKDLLTELKKSPPTVMREYIMGNRPRYEMNVVSVWEQSELLEFRFYSKGNRVVSCFVNPRDGDMVFKAVIKEFPSMESRRHIP